MEAFLTHADDGCKLYFDVEGQGSPVLLIPGPSGTSTTWKLPRLHLSKRFRTISMDQRGTGRSDRPEGTYRVEQLAHDIVSVLDALGESAVTVVGHSTGGAVALCLALNAPHRVCKIVISGGWDKPDARFRLLFQTRLRILKEAGPACYQDLTHALCFPATWIADHEAELAIATAEAEASLSPLSVAAERIRMLLNFDRAAELHRIAVPTLVIGASDDALVPFYHSERLVALIPGAKLEALAGGHFFPAVQPEAYVRLLADFIGIG